MKMLRRRGIPARAQDLKTTARGNEGLFAANVIARWRLRLALNYGIASGPIEEWHLTAQLVEDCATTEEERKQLGQITAALGAPDEPLTPLETAPPGAVHHWHWREGSAAPKASGGAL